MKKKILCLTSAIYIFLYSTIYSFCVPVYATVPAVEFTLFDGFATLFWSLGLGVVGVETAQEKETFEDVMDRSFTEALLGYDAETQSQYTEFCNNVENGYMLIGSKLWQFFREYSFNEIQNSNFFKNVPSVFSTFVSSHTGYYFICYNSYYSSSLRSTNQIFCAPYSSDFSYISPPVKVTEWDNFTDYKWGQITNGYINYYSSIVTPTGAVSDSYTTANTNYGTLRVHWNTSQVNYSVLGYHVATDTNNANLTSLTSVNDENTYDLILDGVWVDNGENITTVDGVIPQVLNSDTVKDVVTDITSGQLTWEDSLTDVIENEYPENPAIPDYALTLPQLDNLIQDLHLERLQYKFPFCIPHDIQLIYSGATAVSSNAPVIIIPMHLEFKNHVYYDNDEAIVIDFSDFDGIINIFREGFFLLFLIGLLWVSIEILQAFFVVTE